MTKILFASALLNLMVVTAQAQVNQLNSFTCIAENGTAIQGSYGKVVLQQGQSSSHQTYDYDQQISRVSRGMDLLWMIPLNIPGSHTPIYMLELSGSVAGSEVEARGILRRVGAPPITPGGIWPASSQKAETQVFCTLTLQ